MEGDAAALMTVDGAEDNPLRAHRASEHDVGPSAEDSLNERVEVFCCQRCGEAFGEEAAYLEHHHQHLPENVYLDDQLDGLHDAGKDNETDHFCTSCSLSFLDLTALHLHMETIHGHTSQKDSGINMNPKRSKRRTYECLECGKCYLVIGHFLNHQRCHKEASKSVFHDLDHLKKKSFQCETCGRNYSRASALDAHRRCHEEKLFKPRNRNSGDSFHTDESAVEVQPRRKKSDDAPEKPFKCACGKAFSASMRLKTHQRFSRNSQCSPEDTSGRPKKNLKDLYCGECRKTFNSHIALFNHQRWHANHSEDPAKRFPCEECGRVFTTLSFYYRHQRMVHSGETPVKSFLDQVCQLQKKTFECEDCGLKFSRASALHSHQLQHTDVFKETEKEAQVGTSLRPQQESLKSERKKAENVEFLGESERLHSTRVTEEDAHVNVTGEDVESYGPWDFNVQVISASESEDELAQDPNPDLELLCESDQEVRDDGDTEASAGGLVPKREMDLNIVQVDFEQAEVQSAPLTTAAENEATWERFDCPDCYRWFTSASSLRVHRMWHRVHKKRQQAQGQSASVHTSDTRGHDGDIDAPHCSHTPQQAQNARDNVLYQAEELASPQLHHPKRKRFKCPDCMMSYLHAASLFNHMKNCSAQKKENISVAKKEYNPKKTLLGPKIYHCEQCGKGFWSLGAYSHHKQNLAECAELRQRNGVAGSLHSVNGRSRSAVKVACPVCGRKFRHKGIMALHMRKHENGNHKCDLCHRSFRLFSSLLRHQVVHNDQLLPPPAKSFQHQVEQLKKNTYSCPDCGKRFSRAKALQFHMKSHGYETGHPPSSPRATVTLEDRQCATCLAHFNNKASLRAHQKLCVKRGRQLNDCKTEPSENNNECLNYHRESTHADTQNTSDHLAFNTEVKKEMDFVKLEDEAGPTDLKYKCDKCDRSFSVVGALNLHKRIHTDSYKPVAKQDEVSKGQFPCSECGRRFMSNAALGSHKRWHKGKKCSRSSPKDDLKSVGHESQDGPLQRDACDDPFFNLGVLQRRQMFHLQCRAKAEPDAGKAQAAERERDGPVLAEPAPGQVVVVGWSGGVEATSVRPKGKVHQCSLCSVTFAKGKGLRAHVCRPRPKTPERNTVVPSSPKRELSAVSIEVKSAEGSSAVDGAAATSSTARPAGRGRKKIRSSPSPVKPAPYLDGGKRRSSTGALSDHDVDEVYQSFSNSELLTPEGSPPLSRLSEPAVKCFFKCDKCGKAFPTEGRLGAHKSKAKSRPYSCALCCHGFWTENLLRQHLAWHDEVRCRLPNEVRFRLSAALTSKPLKGNVPSACGGGTSFFLPFSTLDPPTLNPDSQSQNSHKCQHCGKAFLSPTALQKHESQHCGDDSYHCSICPRAFSEIQDLIDHHQECISDYKRQSDAPATNGLTCTECGTTFCQENDLHQHYMEHARGVY